jgi:hypothetical protein
VLTGEAPPPELQVENELSPKDQFNVRIGRAAKNALLLVSNRYPVTPSQIVEMAPFLFCWAAEASLRWRRKRLEELKDALDTVKKLQGDIFEMAYARPESLEGIDPLTDQVTKESSSIDLRDIFGEFLREDPDYYLDVNAIDPFSAFLTELVADFPDISFEGFSYEGTPSYTVCSETVAQLFGGDRDVANLVLNGFVSLSEMPKEIRGPEATKQRIDWLLSIAKATTGNREGAQK